ncbi:MAG: hypothetical protein AMK72_15505 [Planctomycetes bacterium SM23_25]|nr:MAG: hypothetical protein AMK72_15505 [Planctomycetes bacterium SM23_25]
MKIKSTKSRIAIVEHPQVEEQDPHAARQGHQAHQHQLDLPGGVAGRHPRYHQDESRQRKADEDLPHRKDRIEDPGLALGAARPEEAVNEHQQKRARADDGRGVAGQRQAFAVEEQARLAEEGHHGSA